MFSKTILASILTVASVAAETTSAGSSSSSVILASSSSLQGFASSSSLVNHDDYSMLPNPASVTSTADGIFATPASIMGTGTAPVYRPSGAGGSPLAFSNSTGNRTRTRKPKSACKAKSTASGLLGAANVTDTPVTYTVRTVYATSLYTIPACAPSITDCPAGSGKGSVSTSFVPVSSFVPVTANTNIVSVSATSTALGAIASGEASVASYTISTVYATSIFTVTRSGSGAVTTSHVPVSSDFIAISANSAIVSISDETTSTAAGDVVTQSSASSEIASTGVPAESLTGSTSTSIFTTTAASTVTSASVYSVTSTSAGAEVVSVITDIIDVYTTICPVTATEKYVSGTLVASTTQTAAGVVVSSGVSYSVETVYTTSVYTVTSCGASVTDCPARTSGQISTAIVPLSTNLVALQTGGSESSAISSSGSEISSTGVTGLFSATSTAAGVIVSSGTSYSVETVYATSVYTVTSCGASITDCPARTSGQISTAIVPLSTNLIAIQTGGAQVTGGADSSDSGFGSGSEAFTLSVITTQVRSTVYTTSFFTDSAGSTTSEVVPRYTTVSQVTLTKTVGLGQSGSKSGTTISTALGAIKSGTTSFTKLITTLSTSTVVGTTTYTSTSTSNGVASVIIVTGVVDLYTTICPVTAAQTGVIVANSFTTSTAAGVFLNGTAVHTGPTTFTTLTRSAGVAASSTGGAASSTGGAASSTGGAAGSFGSGYDTGSSSGSSSSGSLGLSSGSSSSG